MLRRSANAALVLAGALLVFVAVAGPASAHVSVQPGEAAQGSYAKLTFRVPNESETAATVKVEVELPASIEGARTRPVPGWTATVDGQTIRWEGGRVEPGQFQEFDIAVGPLPEVEQLAFKAVQTYSDGTVARWIEEAADGAAEPERPAPVLRLTAASGDEHDAAASTDDTEEAAAADEVDRDGVDQDDDSATTLGIAGIVTGAAGLLLGGVALARTRRRAQPDS
jgi:uncharacterized protein YcnI